MEENNAKIVIAVDSFKGSLGSLDAGNAIAAGIKKAWPGAVTVVRPLADGGEGTVQALALGMNGHIETVSVCGPLGQPVNCAYGIIDASRTAVIEMAGAAGLTLVPEQDRNPMNTTTYGVGEVIRDAIHKGCRHFIVGIGGSATNDGGAGMLQALGFGFLDADGNQVPRGAKGLRDLASIAALDALPELAECSFSIACDVANPLCGEQGCSAVFGPQKGADPSMIASMDKWLSDMASLAKRSFPKADAAFPGSGAAGGLGFAFMSFTNAVLRSGVQLVMEETRLEEQIRDAGLVVTGEGRLDAQTVMGKAPIGVARLAKKYGKPVIAFSGCVSPDAAVCNEHGIDAFFPILRGPCTLREACDPVNAARNMTDTAEQVFRLLRCRKGRDEGCSA